MTNRLDTAFSPGKDGTDDAKVFSGRVGSSAHVLEATAELFPKRKVGELLTCTAEWCIIAHLL